MKGYLGIDPGDTTGWAYFDESGQFQSFGQEKYLDFMDTLVGWPDNIGTIVIEDFKLFQWKAKQQSGSTMVASQVIGAVTLWARTRGVIVVKQPASVKPIAQKFSQVKPPSDHSFSHWVDAYNHVWFYMVQQGIRPTPLQEEEGLR